MAVVEARQLRLEFAPGRGVCSVSLAVHEGCSFALLGRNGSGKSTLTRLVLGIARAEGGEVDVLGVNVGRGGRGHLARTGVALDTCAHWDRLSGRQNAVFFARSAGMSRAATEKRVDELFTLADLAKQADDPVETYSFGMRRKLSLVESILHDPELLVLDEPTAGVDAQFLLALAEMVRRRAATGRTTWIASNDPDWVAGTASRVAFMEGGRIVADGTVDELVAKVSSLSEVQIKLSTPTAVTAPELAGLRSFRQAGDRITALLQSDPELVPKLLSGIASQGVEVSSMEVRRGTLRDVFLLVTGRGIVD